ncbi:MAG: nitrous oxide reductase family maturation protein NosD [Acidimicrobiia bacterium]|nr:nitrous oxide reductase family maturation protein NosD [Acidimicrobiia bacterium]
MSRLLVATLVTLTLLAVGLIGAPMAASADAEVQDLQARIDAATPGSTIIVDGGVHAAVTIDKPITLTGRNTPIIDAGGEGSAIAVAAPDVTIEGFTIRNTGVSLDRENSGVDANDSPRITIRNNTFENVLFGVFLRKAPQAVVTDNRIGAMDLELGRRGDGIRLWECSDSRIENNIVSGGRDTVYWFSDNLTVRGNEVTGGRYGLHFMYSDDTLIEENRLAQNSVGVFFMYGRDLTLTNNVMAENQGPSGYGIGLKDMDGITATGNRMVGNRAGMYLDNSPWSVDQYQTIDGNLFAYNEVGVLFMPSVKRNTFTNNAFVDNGEQVGVKGGGQFSGNEWTLDGSGNYWSDFAGFDADGDGIGDVPYRLADLYSTLTDRHPELEFFSETPAARAISTVARIFPVLEPRPKVEDTAPLIHPPQFPVSSAETTRSSTAITLASLVLLATAAATLALGRGGRQLSGRRTVTT